MGNFTKLLKNRKRPSKKWLGLYFLITLLAIFFISMYWVLFNDTSSTSENVEVRDAPRTKSRAGGKSTPSYDEKLKEHNRKEFEKSKNTGNTYIPTVGSQKKERGEDILIEEEEESKPKEKKPKKKTHENLSLKNDKKNNIDISSQRQKEQMEELQEIYINEMQSIYDSGYNKHTKQKVMVFTKSDESQSKDIESISETRKNKLKNKSSKNESLPITAGDVFYAVNDIEVNSDVPGQVKATVLSGDYKDAVFLGTFSQHEKQLIIEFNKFITSDGKTYDVNAVGIDPNVPKSAIQSRVETRTFRRWGGLIAASFLSGLSDAIEKSGTKTVVAGEGTVSTSIPEYTAKQQAMLATGNVANTLEQKASKYFDRPPTVYLDPGEPLGILIMDVK